MNVYWIEQSLSGVPTALTWLSPAETDHLRALRFPKRRADWLLGRWTAKNAVAILLGLPTALRRLKDVEIRATISGAPEVFVRARPAEMSISLSHRDGVGLCALAPAGVLLGCDLEIVEPHGDAFAADYFTTEEQALVQEAQLADREWILSLLWSSKESALKALKQGLRLDTRSVIVSFSGKPGSVTADRRASTLGASPRRSPFPSTWNPVQVRHGDDQVFHGWWSQAGNLVRTLLTAPPANSPIRLAGEAPRSAEPLRFDTFSNAQAPLR